MGAEVISTSGILAILALLIPIFIINKIIDLKMNGSLAISVVRMGLQLLMVSFYLQFLFDKNIWWANLLYLCIMIFVTSFTVIKSCKLKNKPFILLLAAGIAIPIFTVLFFLIGCVIKANQLFDARYIVTLSGMLIGNCMKGIIVSINSFYNDLKDNEATYFLYLSLGATRSQALRPKVLKAMEVALKPSIASMMVTGLVSLPGMMTGQILGGSNPLTAIIYQFVILIGIFVVDYVGVGIMLLLISRMSFTKRDILRTDIFSIR